MKKSTRRRKALAAKHARKAAAMKTPGAKSAYARKVRGEYPDGSPFAPGGPLEHVENIRHINPTGYYYLARVAGAAR